jgi:fatty acid desaturase
MSGPRQITRGGMVRAIEVDYSVNLLVCAAHVALNVFLLFIFPLCWLPNPGTVALAVFAISCTSNGLFSVLHEAIHRSLAPTTRIPLFRISANDLLGRVIGILFGSPFDFISTAHVTHHSVNRSPSEHLEVYDDSMTPAERRSFLIGYYFFLLGGLYKAELIVPMVLWLPKRTALALLEKAFPAHTMAGLVLKRICRSPYHLRAIRLDALAIVACIGLSAALYGRYWWILAVHFVIRAFLVSFLDYTYHYASPLGNRVHGYNLALPRFLSALILNFNYHGIHHRFPALPWRSLRHVFNDERLVFDSDYLTQAVSQLKGPMTRRALENLLHERRPGQG